MITLFDNYESYKYFDDYKQDYLEANDLSDCPDDTIYEIMSDAEQEVWSECMSVLERAFDYASVIVMGTAQTWRRSGQGAQLFKSIQAAVDYICYDCDYIKVWEDKKRIYIRASHHDGTHEFELKMVTPDGERYYDNWSYSTDPRTEKYSEWQILYNIWNSSRYSKLPNKITW